MKYKLAIFDFDGTLADTFPWLLGILDDLADRFQMKKPEVNEIESMRGLDTRTLMRRYRVPMWKLLRMSRHVQARMTADVRSLRLFEGVDQLLANLAQNGTALALVTSNSWENARQVLGPANASLFQYHECGVAIFGKHTKFNKIIQKSGVCPEHAIAIGDEIRDIEAAHKANIPFGAVSWGYARPDVLQQRGPAEIFGNIGEIAVKLL